MPEILAERFARARCVFLDCDGVLFDSNRFKLDVLKKVIAPYPDNIQREMIDYWLDSGGVTRHVKFRYFFETIVKQDNPQRAVDQALAQFSILSRIAYDDHDPLPQAMRLVRATGPSRCIVISGTVQTELRDVFQAKGLIHLFFDVLGSPRNKRQHIADILSRTNSSPSEAIFIGDGSGDFEACRQTGVYFIFLEQMSEWKQPNAKLANAENVTRFKHWDEILAALEIDE